LKIDLQGLTFAVVVGYTFTALILSSVLLLSDWERFSNEIVEVAADEEDSDSESDNSSSSSSSDSSIENSFEIPPVISRTKVPPSSPLPTPSTTKDGSEIRQSQHGVSPPSTQTKKTQTGTLGTKLPPPPPPLPTAPATKDGSEIRQSNQGFFPSSTQTKTTETGTPGTQVSPPPPLLVHPTIEGRSENSQSKQGSLSLASPVFARYNSSPSTQTEI